MLQSLGPWANEFIQIAVTIGLTAMMGIEREEKKQVEHAYIIGGVRTFPLVGIAGYALALVSGGSATPIAAGLLAITALLIISYLHKLQNGEHGATTEVAMLVAYLIGVLIGHNMMWEGVTIAVVSVLLLEAKAPLTRLSRAIPGEEIAAFAKFLILAGVILPVVPNHAYTSFHLNPFKTWLIVVAVSGISYVSYVLQRLLRGRQSILLTGLVGGAYSSTFTTVALARLSKEQEANIPLFSGATLMASAVMYVRLAILLWIFNAGLGGLLGLRFLGVAAVGLIAGAVITTWRRPTDQGPQTLDNAHAHNPLELQTAFIFAALFLGLSVVTQLVLLYLGQTAVYVLGGIMGVTDVDPFILSLTQTAGHATPLLVAGIAVVIAAGSNNLIKGIYALTIGERKTGRASLLWLVLLTAVSLLALIRL